MKKFFIITVDTEGDNLWSWKGDRPITTENTKYIPRFQELCEKFGFKPVYLTNYEMADDEEWVKYSKQKAIEGKCEIGMHLHAWNTPPIYRLENAFGGCPYITEYPDSIIEEKVKTMIFFLKERYGLPIITHRAGRWATNDVYFSILAKYGIKVDCSYTPGLDLSSLPGQSKMCGNDYSKVKNSTFVMHNGIVEVPMTTEHNHWPIRKNIKGIAKAILKGNDMWLRPVNAFADSMKYLIDKYGEKNRFVEFMVHSSELMPGGSPYFKDKEDIEILYKTMEDIFTYAKNNGFEGITLKDFTIYYENSKTDN